MSKKRTAWMVTVFSSWCTPNECCIEDDFNEFETFAKAEEYALEQLKPGWAAEITMIERTSRGIVHYKQAVKQ